MKCFQSIIHIRICNLIIPPEVTCLRRAPASKKLIGSLTSLWVCDKQTLMHAASASFSSAGLRFRDATAHATVSAEDAPLQRPSTAPMIPRLPSATLWHPHLQEHTSPRVCLEDQVGGEAAPCFMVDSPIQAPHHPGELPAPISPFTESKSSPALKRIHFATTASEGVQMKLPYLSHPNSALLLILACDTHMPQWQI